MFKLRWHVEHIYYRAQEPDSTSIKYPGCAHFVGLQMRLCNISFSTANHLEKVHLEKISAWAKTWLVSFNPLKTESFIITRKIHKPLHPPIFMQNHQIQ